MTAEFKVKPCTLWTLHAHDNISDWVKMIIDAIFNFRMFFRLLNTECFIFPGIYDDKGLASVFGLKRFLQSKICNHHFYIYGMFWNAYGVDTNFTRSSKSWFSLSFGMYAWTKMHIHPHYFRFNTGTLKSIWNSVYEASHELEVN